jgi:hypothetical protein
MKRLALLAWLAACGSNSPVDVSGMYSVQLTDGSNGCMFQGFTTGSMAMDIPVTVTQNGTAVTAMVGGLGAVALNAVVGSPTFVGTLDGDALALAITGTQSMGSGGCAYTIDATFDATFDNNAISGTVSYTSATNNNSACGAINGCVTTQDIAGSRPPK